MKNLAFTSGACLLAALVLAVQPAVAKTYSEGAAAAGAPQQGTGLDSIPGDKVATSPAMGAGFEEESDDDEEGEEGEAGVTDKVEKSSKEDEGLPIHMWMQVLQYFGSGNFIQNDFVRQRNNRIWQTWQFSPSYQFELFGHNLVASAYFFFDVNLTATNSNPDYRWVPYNAQLILMDPQIYKEPVTGIAFNGSVRYIAPTSRGAFRVGRRLGGVSGALGASRRVGPVNFSYQFRFDKYLNTDPVRSSISDVSRASDGNMALNPTGGGIDGIRLRAGFGNRSFAMFNTLSVNWAITKALSLSYAVTLFNAYDYKLVQEEDEFTSPYADADRGRTDILSPTLAMSYRLSPALNKVLDLPFSLSASAGIQALQPAQTANNEQIMWPFFYNVFGQNRAANNFGTVYVGLSGSY